VPGLERLLSLTPAGARLRQSVEAAIRRSEQEVLATLPEGDREAFLRSLKSLYACYGHRHHELGVVRE
jgi:DNA-binding MarR family transcriptional regulator